MSVKGDNHGEGGVLAGQGEGLPDDLLVTEVNTIKDTNGEADARVNNTQPGWVMNDLHVSRGTAGGGLQQGGSLELGLDIPVRGRGLQATINFRKGMTCL